MNQFFFWNEWQRPYKQIYWGLFVLLIISISFFLVGWIFGVDIAFPWQTYAQGESINVTIDVINIGPFQLPLEVQNYLLTESFQGGELTLYKWPSYVFAAILGIVFTLAITCVTALRRFWYLVGMGLIIAFLMSLQLENLQLFGTINKTALIIVFVLYLPLSFYYQSINSGVLFSTRLMFFSLITLVTGLLIYFGANVEAPFLHLIAHAYVAPVIISILFILMIGHQMLTGFIFVITKNNNAYSKNSLSHFLIITTIYLVNLLIVILNEIQFLYWELFNFHPFVLLLISSLIGVLLYSYREETYKHIYQFYPIGGFIYLMLGIICFFTIGYHLFTANDAVIEVLEDFILYAHFGYGLIFLIYVLANYLNPLGSNMQVYKILYKPQHMPYFTYRFAGTILVTAFVLVSNYQIPVFHTMSGYYNVIGDLHYQLDQVKIAKVYYRKGAIYDYRNHHANYSMGVIARNEADNAKAAYHFNEAMQKRPTPQAYINMGNIYLEEGKFFDGLFTIRDGLDQFPSDDRIKVNLGLQFEKANEVDSAFIIFNAARNKSLTERSANVNILALLNKGNYNFDADSVVQEYMDEDHDAMKANALVMNNVRNNYWGNNFTTDSVLNVVTGYTLLNQSINNLFGEDSTYLSSLESIVNLDRNIGHKERLQFASALGYYYNQEVGKAFTLLRQLADYNPNSAGYYHYILGLLSLDQEAPLLAVDFLRKSQMNNYEKADLALAIASTEAGMLHEALLYWQELAINIDPITRQIAASALEILQASETTILNDSQLYWYWRYQVSKENEPATYDVLDKLEDDLSKTKIYQDVLAYYLSVGDTSSFNQYYSSAMAHDRINSVFTWLALAKADNEDVIDEIVLDDEKSLSRYDRARFNYYKARAAELKSDTTTAHVLFEKVGTNPFFELGVIGKANYLNSKNKRMEAYVLLLNALEANPYAVNLRKQYILQCGDMDFDKYGDYALEQLRPLISGQQYFEFDKIYQARLFAARAALDYFDEE